MSMVLAIWRSPRAMTFATSVRLLSDISVVAIAGMNPSHDWCMTRMSTVRSRGNCPRNASMSSAGIQSAAASLIFMSPARFG